MEEIIQKATIESLWLTQYEFFIRLLVAAGIGFVIGLERERSFLPEQTEIFAGVRTFTLVAVLGLLSCFLKFYLSNPIFEVVLSGLIVFTIVSYLLNFKRGHSGGTTEVALIVVFLMGAVVLMGYIQLSLIVTVIVLLVLSLKVEIKNLVGQITNDEVYAFLKFVVIALLILPFLPNDTYGPYSVLNPSEIGWVIVLTSAIGFIGYLLVKFIGPNKGIILTGIFGGLVSSTAVTWNFSKKSHEMPQYTRHCAIAIISASLIMIVRVAFWIYLFNSAILPKLLPVLFLLLLTSMGIIWYWVHQIVSSSKPDTKVELGNPLQLKDALFFGILYGSILLLVSFANDYLGNKGLYLASTIAALSDIDAITISLSKLSSNTTAAKTVQISILLATISNTAVKMIIALWFGSSELRKLLTYGYSLVLIAALAGFLWLLF
ncbi:MAG: MgtC/SapB family protein [Sphingobacteriales bacterium]|nr:MAG: MgtC/SapB family protein [Sphingobacteriales bacterium]